MPDKLTDTEIKKALECCVNTTFISDCAKCKMFAFDCKDKLIESALDLINRQKAEIERLEKVRKDEVEKLMSVIDRTIAEAKAEAYKEFAERLKKTFPKDDFLRSTKRIAEDIDNLLKELVGEDK